MILVMVSGFIGRFLFSQLPRNQRGLALSLREIHEEIQAVSRRLDAVGLLGQPIDLAWLMAMGESEDKAEEKSRWRDPIRLWIARRRDLRAWNRWLQEHGFTPSSTRQILLLLSRKMFLEGSLATLNFATRAFSHWHGLHVPLTYLMFACLLIHVGLMVLLGYTWIF